MPQTQSFITCHIDGITSTPSPEIQRGSFKRIDKAVSAVRILLSSHGDYTLEDTPQFCSSGALLAVVPTHAEAIPFDAKMFDLYARNIAEFIEAHHKVRDPVLTHAAHALAIDDIEDVCSSLKRYGTVVFQVDGMAKIELRNRRKWNTRRPPDHVTIAVGSAGVVAGLEYQHGELIVNDMEADAFRPGDSISIKDSNNAEPIRRAVASLVRVLDDSTAVTIDMFTPDPSDG